MKRAIFLDTNILVYAALQADHRSERARALLNDGAVISVQVLNEFADVASRKLRRPWPEIMKALDAVRMLCRQLLPVTASTHDAAVRLAAETGYRIYDAMIVASALEADCSMLFSEDLQNGRVFEQRLRIVNPFAGG